MSFCTLTDNLGNSYQLASGDRIVSLAASDYFCAIDALPRIDYLQLSSAEEALFRDFYGAPERTLFSQPGSGWQHGEGTGVFSARPSHPHIGMEFLPGRWPQILDAIYLGNLRFIHIGTAKPTKSEKPQDNRSLLRVKIRQALFAIIAVERAQAAHLRTSLGQETSINRGLIYTGAFLTGLRQAGQDLAQWLKEMNDVVSPLQRSLRGVRATHRALQRNEGGEGFLDAYQAEILTAEKREIVQVLGFDPTAITREQFLQATELADLIWDDPALQLDLRRFVKDYVSAQHAIEITEFSGAAAFEVLFTILLAAITGGAGLAASVAGLSRHFARFRKVGELLVEFGEQVRNVRLQAKQSAAGGGRASFNDFESLGEAEVIKPSEPPATARKPAVRGKTDFSKRKGVPPASLDDAVDRFNSMKQEIARNGYQPKYTDAELRAMVEVGDVGKERFQVRFMESGYLTFNGGPGLLGAPMRGVSGSGAKYWSTSFDQLEDADTDARLIAEKLGLKYDPKQTYALIVIDTEKAAPLTGVDSVPATFEKVSEFANRELPDEFPSDITDVVMTPEFQEQYARHYQAAVDEGFLKNSWSTDMRKFGEYLNNTDLSRNDKNNLMKRMGMQSKVGNNQYYEGNGLTRDNISESGNHFGVVETLNFERNTVNLKQLEDAGAITYVSKGL